MLLESEAAILHVLNYSESSRIFRLVTREAGVLSAIARGARRGKSGFGSAVDLFSHGTAHISVKEGRDLQTLATFDVTRSRAAIASDLGRFAAASVFAELVLRFGTAEASPDLFDALSSVLDRIAVAPAGAAQEAGLSGAWRLVCELGFAPSVNSCGLCHAPVGVNRARRFSHDAGGVLCDRCAPSEPGARTLPPEALACLVAWTNAHRVGELAQRDARAHKRLLHEFVQHHMADGREMRALEAWDTGPWRSA
ncbi:MAG: DNA repair protein RecO [Gemmatimonadaceae bacterium]